MDFSVRKKLINAKMKLNKTKVEMHLKAEEGGEKKSLDL